MQACGQAIKYNKVTHCIFDMDGTLLDTEAINEQIFNSIVEPYGKKMDPELRMKVIGTTERVTCGLIVENLQLPISVDEFVKRFREMSDEMMSDVPLMKGAQHLMCHLCCHRIPIALATSSSEDSMKIKSAKHKELFGLFHHLVCGSSDPEVKESKPAPDIFLVAASRFRDKPDPAQCLVFEDAPNGVLGAHRAGMQVVMIPDAHVPEELRIHATKVLVSMDEFKPEEFGLPPFPICR